MELGRTVAEKTFEIRGSELIVSGVPASEAVRRFGSPVYLYDLDVLKRTYRKLRDGLRDDIRLFYSLKANPSLCIGAAFCELGAGAEIASLGELETALKAGFRPENIIFAGPGKQRRELEASVRSGLLSINAESTEELKTIGRIAGELGQKASVGLRINPKENVSGSQMMMGGGPSPFGLDEERISEALSICDAQKHLVFQGIHVYVGNQILDAELAVANIENTLNIARKVASERPEGSMKLVNLGGGLGIPYYKHQREFDIEGFIRELNRGIESIKKEPSFRDTTFILELGRYLVAACGVFLTTVLYVKESRGKRFAVTDGGMNANSLATGNLAQKIRRNCPMCPVDRMNEPFDRSFDIVGPLCTPTDRFGRDFKAPDLKPGDVLCVPLAGAYGLTASPGLFLSHPGCREAAASEGRLQLVRERETIDTVLQRQSVFIK